MLARLAHLLTETNEKIIKMVRLKKDLQIYFYGRLPTRGPGLVKKIVRDNLLTIGNLSVWRS